MIQIQNISKQFGSKMLLDQAEAHIGDRSRIALVGPNGAGKSTLIKMLLGFEEPDSGKISRTSHITIGHLAQETPKFSGYTVLSETMRLDGRREKLLSAKEELEKDFSNSGQENEEKLSRYGRILEELEILDEFRLESRAQEILMGMGFKVSDFHRPLTELSGGWLMRVALSRILLMEPDLLLLDEPTNHLDLDSLLWLEEFLLAYRGALLLVSHDTAFLNRVVREVLEIDQRKLWTYKGNLDAYYLQKEERLNLLRAQYESQQAKVEEIEDFVSRFGAKASKARQAQSRLKQLEKMELIELPEHRETVRFRFPPAPRSGREVVTAKNMGMSFGSKRVYKNVNWTIQRGSRVAIVGVNGVGKTTLLRILSGQIEATEGEVKLGHEVKAGYYAQHQSEALDLSKTVLEELESTAPSLPISQVRGIAGAFLFSGNAVEKKCAVLSGGEKARVALAKLLLSPSNFLILDEPTNHLDVESRKVLLEALQNYEGTLCLVSHDRAFVSPLVNSVLEIRSESAQGQGSEVIQLLGGYEDYLEKKLKETSGRLSSSSLEKVRKEITASEMIRKGPSNNQKQAWTKERDRLENEITKLEQKQAELHLVLGQSETYTDKARSLKLLEEQRQVEKSLGEKLSRWEELCTLLQ